MLQVSLVVPCLHLRREVADAALEILLRGPAGTKNIAVLALWIFCVTNLGQVAPGMRAINLIGPRSQHETTRWKFGLLFLFVGVSFVFSTSAPLFSRVLWASLLRAEGVYFSIFPPFQPYYRQTTDRQTDSRTSSYNRFSRVRWLCAFVAADFFRA